MGHRARLLAICVALGLVAACSSGSTVSESAPPITAASQQRVVYVALGGDETVNRQLDDPLRDAWPQRLFTEALPREAVYVNLARPDATVMGALTEQVPNALDLDPTLATVWLGSGDAQVDTSDTSFAQGLSDVVAQLQSHGAMVLLLTKQQGRPDETQFAEDVSRVAAASGSSFVVVPDGDGRLPATQAAIASAVAAQLQP